VSVIGFDKCECLTFDLHIIIIIIIIIEFLTSLLWLGNIHLFWVVVINRIIIIIVTIIFSNCN